MGRGECQGKDGVREGTTSTPDLLKTIWKPATVCVYTCIHMLCIYTCMCVVCVYIHACIYIYLNLYVFIKLHIYAI